MSTNLINLRRNTPQSSSSRIIAPRSSRSEVRVALVAMPFAARIFPSIQLGLLTAIGRQRGFSVTPFHFNLDFAKAIGLRAYEALAAHRGCVSGEWLFAKEAFGSEAPDDEEAFFAACSTVLTATLEHARLDRQIYSVIRQEVVPKYLDGLMATTDWSRFDVVGFTSCFEQNVASFALARRIKDAHPHIVTLFGGSNFDGEMGPALVGAIDVIDYAVVGEADEAFPEFLDALYEGRDPTTVPGVVGKKRGEEKTNSAVQTVNAPLPRAVLANLDSLPTPVYDEYFERSEALRLSTRDNRGDFQIPFESARGCWWGQKQHCTFCGFYNLTFRPKSAERVRAELGELAMQTESFKFLSVDNIIDTSYFSTLLPELTKAQSDYTFFYEVKSNLTRAQIKLLADSGVRQVQPGIESLSSSILTLMRKGARAIQQVNMLRWAQYYGVLAEWNVLFGFPGEKAEHYSEQVALVARIRHLRPPNSASRIWMERFAPIYFDEKYVKKYIRPQRGYAHVYPANTPLDRIAYFFDYELENTLPDEAYGELRATLTQWKEAWTKSLRHPSFFYWSSPNLVRLEDRREPAKPATILLRDLEATLYTACTNAPRSADALAKDLQHQDGASVAEIEQLLVSMDERALMMREGNKFLSLALPAIDGR